MPGNRSRRFSNERSATSAYNSGAMPAYGAIWLTLYPNIMVEWYPHVLVVSTLHPRGPRKTLNMVEFYYREEIVAFADIGEYMTPNAIFAIANLLTTPHIPYRDINKYM